MTRLISGVVLGSAALAAILYLPATGLRVLACVVAALAAREYVHIVRQAGRAADGPPTGEHADGGIGSRHASHAAEMSTVVVLVVLTCWLMDALTPITLIVLLLGGLALVAFEVICRGYPLDRAAVSFLAPWYLGMPLGMLVVIHGRGGRAATLLLLGTIVISDSAQYYSGRLFGRHLLAPTISPRKTIEGALGGLVFGALIMTTVGPRVLPQAGRASLACAGITLVVLGVCGDLFESRLKRMARVKDSSSLIPGHGGVLDRIDALLFATPAFYVYLISLT